jgi:hypothetical protein
MSLASLETIRQQSPFSVPGPVHVPVSARGAYILDNGGDVVAMCHTACLAHKLADLLNRDAGFYRG